MTHIVYGYDEFGRMETVTAVRLNDAAANELTTYTYDVVGNLDTVTYENDPGIATDDVVSDYGYDALNRLTGLTVTRNGQTLFSQQYILAADGKRESVLETRLGGGTVFIDWEYDALGRLIEETRDEGNDSIVNGNDYAALFSYDLASNRMKKVQTGYQAATTTYAYNDRDQLTAEGADANSDGIPDPATATTYAYDDNGSTISKTIGASVTAFAWDLRNRMVAVDAPGTASDASYSYDTDGVRVGRIVDGDCTFYLNDSQNPTGYAKAIEEYDLIGTLQRSYVFGSDIVAQVEAGSSPMYFLKDGHGTTRALLDNDGQIITGQSFDFDAFGDPVGMFTAATEWLAPDGRKDGETGFTYSLARYRSGWRFVTEDDPRYGSTDDPATLHKYLYANANPISLSDPTGHFSATETGVSTTIGVGGTGAFGGAVAGIANFATTALRGSIAFYNGMMGGVANATMADSRVNAAGAFGVGFLASFTASALQLNGMPCWLAAGIGGVIESAGNDFLLKGKEAFSWDTLFSALANGLVDGVIQSFFQCFVAGTLVLEGDGATTAPIEYIHVGQRVATDGGVSNSIDGRTAFADPNATQVDPATWRLVTIIAGDWSIQTLQPLNWIEARGLSPKASMRLADVVDLAEMGTPDDLVGMVQGIDPCPPIEGGYGRVVLTTVSHLSDFVFDLTLRSGSGELDSVGVTGWHKIYTEDLGWVSARELRPDQVVRTAYGEAIVTGLHRRPGVFQVYNMTVEGDHVYYVSNLAALVHNNKCRRDLGGVDGTGKWHGNLPNMEDLIGLTRDELKDMLSELRGSLAQRNYMNAIKGADAGHLRRALEDMEVIKMLRRLLK